MGRKEKRKKKHYLIERDFEGTFLIEQYVRVFIGALHPQGDRDYPIRSNFWKFFLIRTGFTLGEPVSLVKVFRLFKLEQMLFLILRVWTQ